MRALVRYADQHGTWWPVQCSLEVNDRECVFECFPKPGRIDGVVLELDSGAVVSWAPSFVADHPGRRRMQIPLSSRTLLVALVDHAEMVRTLTIAQQRGTDLTNELRDARAELARQSEIVDELEGRLRVIQTLEPHDPVPAIWRDEVE